MKIKRFLHCLLSELHNRRDGNVLIMAVMLCALLFIWGSVTLRTVHINENIRENVGYEENAYLAAKSGIEVFKKLAATESGANKIRSARGKDAMTMDLGDFGQADIKVYTVTKKQQDRYSDGSLKFEADGITPIMVDVIDDERVKIECTGKYEDRSFKLIRYENIIPANNNTFPFEKKAYTQYSDKDIILNGHIDGPILVYGDARVNVLNALNESLSGGVDHEMHELIASGNVDMRPIGGGSSSVVFKYIVAGGHLIIAEGEEVKGDVLVGSKNEDGTVKDGVYFYGEVPVIGGALKCEGDIILGNTAKIGTTNWDGTSCINSNEIVLWSNGRTYVGYSCTAGDTGYSNLSPENSSKYIYGGIVSKGDLYIYGTATIYGDIYCNGNVYIEQYPTIYGNIYAAGEVNQVLGNADTFPNNSEIWAGGNITVGDQVTNVAKKSVSDGSITQEDLDSILLTYFDGRDIIGADKYLTDEKIKSPRPIVTFPSKFSTMTPQSFLTSVCTGCTDPAYNTHAEHKAIVTCYWCTNAPYYDSETYTHTPHQVEADYNCSGCGDPAYNVHTSHPIDTSGPIHITADCIIDEDIVLNGRNMYIDASNNDIDIMLRGSITTDNNGMIFINDGAGAHKVRLFMDSSAQINLKNSWGGYTGFASISDAYPTLAVDDLPVNALDTKVAPGKVSQFYVFSRDGGSPEINMSGSAVYMAAYVIAPDLTVNITDGSGRGQQYSNGDTVDFSNSKYPYLYGLFTVSVVNFCDKPSTHIKYDETLEDYADGTQSINGKKFSDAIADVISYPTT